MRCLICQKECNGAKGLGLHVSKTHGVAPKAYYDKYLREEGEGVCLECKGETTFESLGRPYIHPYCSKECEVKYRQKTQEDLYAATIQEAGDSAVQCAICLRQFTRLSGLGAHIVRTHKISTQQYYDEYLKIDPTEGSCLECGKPTFFQDMYAGYPSKYCSMACNKAESKRGRLLEAEQVRQAKKEQWVKCFICGQKVIGYKGLANHIRCKHHVTAQQYYDAYMRKMDEGFCSTCTGATKFHSFEAGYRGYCSNNCYNKSPEHKAIVSAAKSVKPSPLKGKPSPLKGRPQEYEHTLKIRKAHVERARAQCEKYGLKFPTVGKNEPAFFEALGKVTEYTIEPQHETPDYHFLDGYIEPLNLAIEFDEYAHDVACQQVLDREREQQIREALPNIAFFRVTQKRWEEEPELVLTEFIALIEKLTQGDTDGQITTT